ncbi:hypothetical protein BJ322DRAFT_1007497 [Thelephora terrestris]|uniref:D-lactate dehydrogenase (cytochrome) n=1 Tax=Thelephora terrestris TaxID=56493 RepID=A0A9P6HCQ6_9AGAM|nr:hypothetical protein BJ322DRAFT_1007497 [Thelephora terrestris]
MQRIARHARVSLKSFPLSCPGRRISAKRSYIRVSESPQRIPRGRNTTLLLVGTALLSVSSGYLLATYNSPKSGGTEEAHASSLDNLPYGTAKDFQEAIKELKATFPSPGAVSDDPEVLEPYGFSEYDHHPVSNHTVVVHPESTEDVAKIVKVATKYRIPVTPYSGGTSLEGNFRAHPSGGICVDMSGMDKILEIHEEDSDLVCQAGARWMDVNEVLKEKGIPLFFPLDPGPGATMGGIVSTGGSGTNAVRYGTARAEWFLNITVVLPSGEIIKTRSRARKSAAGPDLTKLFIGAEGTLGIVTEVTVRLAPLLKTDVAVVQFPNVRHATEAVKDILNKGIGIQCIELLDDKTMGAINKYGQSIRKRPEKDSLFIKFQGPTEASILESIKLAEEITKEHGGTGFDTADNQEEAEALWADRKNAAYAVLALMPGCKYWPTDVCVPVSKLPELVFEAKKEIAEAGLLGTILGHVGDGNFHAQLLFTSDEEYVKAKKLVKQMVKRAIALGGTCTGEHGVGIGKREYLYEELGHGTVELMKNIRKPTTASTALRLSGAFETRSSSGLAGSSIGFRVAFRWLSWLPVGHVVPAQCCAPFPYPSIQLPLQGCVLKNCLKCVIIYVLIYIGITEVVESRRVVKFPRNKLVPEVR